jgi:hypothetical protein
MQGVTMTRDNRTGEGTMGTKGLAGWIPDLSLTRAARLVGIGLVLMVTLAAVVEVTGTSALLMPENGEESLQKLKDDGRIFATGMALYGGILVLDVLVAWGLFVVFRPVNRDLSLAMAVLRLLYTAIMVVTLTALAVMDPGAYVNGHMIAYVFFIGHIGLLGYLAYVSGYVHWFLGGLLMVASFSYVFLTYGDQLLSNGVPEAILPIFMIPATLSEISLAIWLLWKAKMLPGMVSQAQDATSA